MRFTSLLRRHEWISPLSARWNEASKMFDLEFCVSSKPNWFECGFLWFKINSTHSNQSWFEFALRSVTAMLENETKTSWDQSDVMWQFKSVNNQGDVYESRHLKSE
jgi:hypothetical protein